MNAHKMEKLRTHIEQIVPINEKEFEVIKTHFTKKRVRKGQYLLSEGDEVKHEYFVLSGIYKIFYVDEQGKDTIFWTKI